MNVEKEKKRYQGPGSSVAQCLLYKLEDLSSIPATQGKKDTMKWLILCYVYFTIIP